VTDAGEAGDAAVASPGAVTRGLMGLNGWLGRHWVALLALASGVFIALPLAAPILAMTGHDRAAGAIYFTYRMTCHQLPQRSWFVGGPKPTYTWPEVQPYVADPAAGPLMAFHHPLGNAALGYQLAFCERDTAIYLAVFATCLAYGFLRRRRTFRPMPIRLYVLFLLPAAIDGITQLTGLRESTPLLRTVTGALFGAGSAWLILTYLDAERRQSASYAAAYRVASDGPDGG
jgi:uncharacterized membrane protein